MFDDMNCTACGLEEETQEHVLICSKLTNNKGDNGTVSEKLMITKMFKENYEVLENMKKWKEKLWKMENFHRFYTGTMETSEYHPRYDGTTWLKL